MLSLDLPTGEEGDGASLSDLLPTVEPEPNLTAEQRAKLKEIVRELISPLKERQQRLILLYYGLDDENRHSFAEVAQVDGAIAFLDLDMSGQDYHAERVLYAAFGGLIPSKKKPWGSFYAIGIGNPTGPCNLGGGEL